METEYFIDSIVPRGTTFGEYGSEDNPILVETAGFVPLEVRFKQLEDNGIRAQFNAAEFDSQDYRDLYLRDDIRLNPNDDLETVEEKLALQRELKEKIISSKVDLKEQFKAKYGYYSGEELKEKELKADDTLNSVDEPISSVNGD